MPFHQTPPRLGNQLTEDALLREYLDRHIPGDALGEMLPSLHELGELSGGALYYHVAPGEYQLSATKEGFTVAPVKMKCRAGYLVNAGPPIGVQTSVRSPDWGAGADLADARPRPECRFDLRLQLAHRDAERDEAGQRDRECGQGRGGGIDVDAVARTQHHIGAAAGPLHGNLALQHQHRGDRKSVV